MAERSNATAKNSQDAALDVSTLQKRGRRRLVGAIALVLLAVIVLPMVFDPEPKPNVPLVSVRIPSEEGGKFTPKVLPQLATERAQGKPVEAQVPAVPAPVPAAAPVAPLEAAKSAEKPLVTAEPAKPVAKAPEPAKPAAKTPEPAKPAKAAEKPAPRAAEKGVPPVSTGETWLYQVGAFASPEKVKEITDQLQVAKLPHYTESLATAKGRVTRVRLGPFTSKPAADRALERARALGLNPVNVVPK